MGRLRYAVASTVVLLAFQRFSDEKFIIESFHLGHGGSSSGVKSSSKQTPPHASNATQWEMNSVRQFPVAEDDDYVVGEFCPHCTFNTDSLCIDRVNYLMQRYKIDEANAKNNNQVQEKCMAPPIPHNFYAEEDEPSVIIHAGPHKTGTTGKRILCVNNLCIL